MGNISRKIIPSIFFLSFITLYGQSGIDPTAIKRAGQSGWQFLKINGDPHQAAMGGVYLVNHNANAVFGSPANLAGINTFNVQFNSVNWLADDYELISIRPKLVPYRYQNIPGQKGSFP